MQGLDASLRPALKIAGFMTRDSRVRERKKPGQKGARKKFACESTEWPTNVNKHGCPAFLNGYLDI